MKAVVSLLVVSFGLGSAAYAVGNEWNIDTSHSSATFTVRHMMVSNVPGQMSGVKGKVEFDGKNVETIKVSATLDPSTVNTNDPGRDEHLRGTDFFDVQKFPAINFESTGPVTNSNGVLMLPGKLTLHGVTRSVNLVLDQPTESYVDSKKGIEKIGANATATINRQDFGISYNSTLDHGGVAISDQVKITLNLELHRKLADKISSK